MGIADSFSGASVLAKVSLFVILLACLLNWIAFTTTSWGLIDRPGSNADTHLGLWRQCSSGGSSPGCIRLDGYAKVWFGVVQAFSIFGFMGLNVGCLLIVLYIFWDTCKKNGEAGLAAGIICIVSAVFWLLAIIIFGAKYEDDNDVSLAGVGEDDKLGYSFGLAIVAVVLEVIAGVLMIMETKKS